MSHPVLDDLAEFTWNFGSQFFIETKNHGNWVWSDPDYQGDHTLTKTELTVQQWLAPLYGRDKGKGIVRYFVGEDVRIVE